MADLRIQYMDEMVGAGHPAKADTLNRLMLSEHGINGAHKWLDVTHPDFGATGDGVTDDTAAVQAAFDAVPASGGIRTVYFPAGTYIISAPLNLNKHNMVVRGEGSLSVIKVKDNTGDLQAGGYGSIFNIAATVTFLTIRDLQIDGNADNNTTSTYNGIGGVNTDHLTIQGVVIRNTPFNAILLTATTAPHTNLRITGNFLRNIGWRGIQVEYGDTGIITGNEIFSTGSQGIALVEGTTVGVHSSRGVLISGNIINRSIAPSTILTGQVEKDMMIILGRGSQYIIVDGNICHDNSRAGDDGIAVGASIPSDPFFQSIIISNNVVTLAGGFGIDATSQCIVTGNFVSRAATHGIVIAGDLGANRKDTIIANNIIYNPNQSNSNAGAGIYIGPGGTPSATWSRLRVLNNTVFDEGLKTRYGVYLNATNVAMSNIEIRGNDLEKVTTESIYIVNAPNITNLRVKDNIEKNLFRTLPAGATPSVLGGEFFQSANTQPTTITMFNDGYIGQRIHIRFADTNTTIQFAGSALKGNGGVNFTGKAGDFLDCVFQGTQWACIVGSV